MIGGVCLCFLALRIWKAPKRSIAADLPNRKVDAGIIKSFFLGLFAQLSNPKTAIIFVGAFAEFLPKGMSEYSYILVISLVFLVDSIWYILISVLFSTSKAQSTYKKFEHYICKGASGLIGAMGITLLSGQQLI